MVKKTVRKSSGVRRQTKLRLTKPQPRPAAASAPEQSPPDDPAHTTDGDERTKPSATLTVLAVGASAGGLDAFSQILENLPAQSNVAFVFVQHLSPQHESALPTLLSARTPMPVVQATDGARIEANHVYVMPPNVHMEIADGHLNLLPRPHDRSQFTPIDVFFESLTRWARARS